jgi:hypothetical protein
LFRSSLAAGALVQYDYLISLIQADHGTMIER